MEKVTGCHFWGEVTKGCSFCLEHTLLVFLLLTLRGGSCHVVSWPMEMPRWKKSEGDLQPTANEELRSPAQQPVWSWILPTTTWVGKEVNPHPLAKPSDETTTLDSSMTVTSLVRDLDRGTLLNCTRNSDPQKTWDHTCMLLYVLNLGVIFYTGRELIHGLRHNVIIWDKGYFNCVVQGFLQNLSSYGHLHMAA